MQAFFHFLDLICRSANLAHSALVGVWALQAQAEEGPQTTPASWREVGKTGRPYGQAGGGQSQAEKER